MSEFPMTTVISRVRATPAALSLVAAACLSLAAPPAAQADPWKDIGAWKVISLSDSPGCMMGTKYSSGAVLVVSARYASNGAPSWELLAADRAWDVIEQDSSYPIDIHIPGSDQPARRHEMHSYSTTQINGLVAKFTDFDEFSAFITNGMTTGTHLSLVFDGRLMGTFSLKDAGPAYDELLNCYAHAVARLKS